MSDVLLIEDDDLHRDLIERILQDEGISVVSARDGRAGIDRFRERPTRVVLTDMYLPEADGLEVLTTLKRAWPGVPIIVMSGGGVYANLVPLRAAEHLGAFAALRKPFSAQELLMAVRAALDD